MEERIQRRSDLGLGKVQDHRTVTGMVKGTGNVKLKEKTIREEKIAVF